MIENFPFFRFRATLFCLVALLSSIELAAQDTLRFNLSAPYYSVTSHLENLQAENYHPEVAAQVFNQDLISVDVAEDLAIKLKQIWDGEGIFIAVDNMPKDPLYLDSLNGQHKYVVVSKYPDIFLTKNGDRWQYGSSSQAAIERIHNAIYPLGADFLVNLFPESSHNKILGMQLWQYIGLIILLILSWVVYRIFIWVFKNLLVHLAHRMGYKEVLRTFVHPVAKPFSWMVVLLFLLAAIPTLQLPITLSKYLVIGFKTALPVFAVLVFYHLADVVSLYLEKLASRTKSTLDDQLIPIVRRSLKVFIIAIGALFILHNLDVNITALLAGLSIGGLALALAAQETLKNFFGSVMIFIDRPFQIGDWISGDGVDGTVEEVGFRSTRIRTFRNSVVSVPNGRLADLTIDNHGLRAFRRFNTHLSITYDTPVEVIEAFVEGLKKLVDNYPHTRKDYYEIHLHEMGSSSLNILFYIFFKVPGWTEELRARHEILLQILELAEALQIRFAFPTQTLHMETFPGKPSLTPEPLDDMKNLKTKIDQYFKQNPE